MSQILVKRGEYRNTPVRNTTFRLVKGFHSAKLGNYVTVINDGNFEVDIDRVKIKVDRISDIEYINSDNGDTVEDTKITVPTESDDEAMDRIASRFKILDEMSAACINGDIRSLIVSGPPGVGKSYGIEQQLEKSILFSKLAEDKDRFTIVKGAMSGIGLFRTLFEYSNKRNLIVLDDCDVWQDQDALNILKGALDSGKTRRISWNKDSRLLRDEGIPNSFNFNGSMIFITNANVDHKKSRLIQPHLEALQSRSHYLDLTIDTERDKMLRIMQVHRDAPGGIFADRKVSNTDEIIQFMKDNQHKLREVSIRVALKISDLVVISPGNWKLLAESTCMKRD